jgi:hypothetical protein
MDAAASLDAGFDFDDLGFLDGLLECFDLDLPADFGDSFLGEPGKDGGLGLDLGSPDGGRESSPESVVTDDGAPSSGDREEDDGGMSAYVSDLERFLMEDSVDYEVGAPPTAEHKEFAPDECFLTDYFVADDGCTEPAAGAGVNDADTTGVEDELELAVDDYFLDDYYVEDQGYAMSAAGDTVDDDDMGLKEEEIAGDEYCFDDLFAADDVNGCAEPASAAGVLDAASSSEDDDFAAREDEASSRKRARYE